MSELTKKWIPFHELVREDRSFKACPVCGGEVMQSRFGGMFPQIGDTKCRKCCTTFKPYKKWRLLKGFLIIRPKIQCPFILSGEPNLCRACGETTILDDEDLKLKCRNDHAWVDCQIYKRGMEPRGRLSFPGRVVW